MYGTDKQADVSLVKLPTVTGNTNVCNFVVQIEDIKCRQF